MLPDWDAGRLHPFRANIKIAPIINRREDFFDRRAGFFEISQRRYE
jgi:hypothetical protein